VRLCKGTAVPERLKPTNADMLQCYHHLSAFEFTLDLSRVKSFILEWEVL